MTHFTFRKLICKFLKKLLFILEENETEYYPAISSTEGTFCKISVIGKETGLVKKNKRVGLSAD